MNEEMIKACAREASAEYSYIGRIEIKEAAEKAIRLYHARVVAPLERENAELRATIKEQTEQVKADGERIGLLEGQVAELVEAAQDFNEALFQQGLTAKFSGITGAAQIALLEAITAIEEEKAGEGDGA